MNTLHQVYQFCNNMRANFGAGFMENRVNGNVVISGEYYTGSRQLMSMTITINNSNVEVRIYDMSKRLVFNSKTESDINMNKRLITFINRSVSL